MHIPTTRGPCPGDEDDFDKDGTLARYDGCLVNIVLFFFSLGIASMIYICIWGVPK